MVQPSGEQQSCAADPTLISRARDVGNEFVYIYYMSVNKCPMDLHRFYSSTSLFVHGGREAPGQEQQPACGQAAIAERIANLKLLDCRTKILMVDSMPDSTGEGVLIQVCGEISNNAGPMRRFMQTFLLAPNGPKKYFVQRDIFRYQDEVFTDADASSVSDAAMEMTAAEPAGDAEANAATVAVATGTTTPPPAAVSADEPPGLASPMAAAAAAAAANGDGSMAADDSAMTTGAEQSEESAFAAADAAAASTVPKEIPAPIVSGGGGSGGGAAGGSGSGSVGVRKNFAALFGGGSAAAAPPAAAAAAHPPPPPPQQQQQPQAAPRKPTTAAPVSTNGQAKPDGQQWGPEQDMPDNHQVFVGNIGPDVEEADLIEEFSTYGPVVSCRINSNRNRPPGSAGFGFVSFAYPETARLLIDMKKINTSYGTTLNLEEKKSSGRRGGGFGGGRGGGGGGNFGRGGRGSSRR